MVAVAEAQDIADVTSSTDVTDVGRRAAPTRRRKLKLGAAAVALVALAGATGWFGPQLYDRLNQPSYIGEDASKVAKDLGCKDYKQSSNHDESVYKYHDQGSCTLDGTKVTITTFDSKADGDAFLTLMRGLIPVVHPTWVGAATAAGDGWNVADATNLSPEVAELAVVRLGDGAVHVIPSAKRS